MKLRYTLKAAGELESILAYLDERSPQGARRVKSRLQEVTALILQHPEAGLLTSRRGLRRIVAYPYPYLIFYEAIGTEIVIHGIRHGARDIGSD